MSLINWFVGKFMAPSVEAGPVAVVCNCPNCGHVVMTTFLATKERLEAVSNAKNVSRKPALVDMADRNGTGGDDIAENVLRERRERAAEREKRPLYRPKDEDLRDQPDV